MRYPYERDPELDPGRAVRLNNRAVQHYYKHFFPSGKLQQWLLTPHDNHHQVCPRTTTTTMMTMMTMMDEGEDSTCSSSSSSSSLKNRDISYVVDTHRYSYELYHSFGDAHELQLDLLTIMPHEILLGGVYHTLVSESLTVHTTHTTELHNTPNIVQ